MTITLDGFEIMKCVSSRRKTFEVVEADVDKAAMTILQKRLKDKNLTLAHLREVAGAIGQDNFQLVLDTMADKDVGGLIGKVDKLWPSAKQAALPEKRRHMAALASGQSAPTPKPAPPPPVEKPPRKSGKKQKGWTTSMSARPGGR